MGCDRELWNFVGVNPSFSATKFMHYQLSLPPPFLFTYWLLRTGLPPSITDPNDSDSDTEPEDEADEDSNGSSPSHTFFFSSLKNKIYVEEEYYKNDYPDEEDPSDDSDSSGALITPSFIRQCLRDFNRHVSRSVG